MKQKLLILTLTLACLYACRQKKPQIVLQHDGYYEKAEALLDRKNDSAFYYYNKAAGTSRDSLLVARAYNRMAALQSDAGDYFGSQESLSLSLKFLSEDDPKDRSCLASDYNELGTTSLKLKNYKQAIIFYDHAIRFTNKKELLATLVNNQGTAYQELRNYRQAMACFRKAVSETHTGSLTYARILTNMATTRWQMQHSFNAAPDLLTALRIRLNAHDRWGENSSYIHLSQYYALTHPDSALFYAGKMYTVATLLDSPDDRLEALQQLIMIEPAREAKHDFVIYQRLSDSVQTARNAAKNQFALIRYDSEKNKLDKLKLQKENAEKKFELFRQSIVLYSAIFAFSTLSVIAVIWYRKRKQRLELEARERELQLSQKVHDGVAGGLYRVMKKVENQQEIDRGSLLDEIDALYEQSRDISHELSETGKGGFDERIKTLLADFEGPGIQMALAGNTPELWNKVGTGTRRELLYILQELMVNMRKHSHATTVGLIFKIDQDGLEVSYADNGTGFPTDMTFGNGLRNTENRIKRMKGLLTFGTEPDKGLRIRLLFPIL